MTFYHLLYNRYNDGEAMLAFWRLDCADFANNKHHKYLVMAHHLLAGKYCMVVTLDQIQHFPNH